MGRLFPSHPKIPLIEEDICRKEAGHIGEQRLDRLLTNLPEKNYYLFQGLHIPNKDGSFFQIDNLLYHSTHIICTEVKYMTGELTIDRKSGQMIQRVENKQIGYEDPMMQAEFQVRQLRAWLAKYGFPSIPIEPLVMMSNPNCIVRIGGDPEALYRVCRGRQIMYRIEDFSYKYKNEILTPPMLKKLGRLLLKEDCEPRFDIEKIYKILRSELRPGVHCPDCRFLGMTYYQGSWFCPRCKCKSRDAHMPALRDYFLLHGSEITNQQFREFLGISNGDVAYQILKKLHLPSSGKNRHRTYQLLWDLFK
jgi:hypothetical protein